MQEVLLPFRPGESFGCAFLTVTDGKECTLCFLNCGMSEPSFNCNGKVPQIYSNKDFTILDFGSPLKVIDAVAMAEITFPIL